MNRNQRRMAAFNAKKAAEAMNESRFEKKVARALSGCSLNVAKATTLPSLRDRNEGGAVCLPAVAIYSAGHRKSKDIVTAR
ncbi:hypothetical protein [[Erwinia] mediterraneensis]|uniref:transcriptional antitermination N peptide n=1 Tax=[Erwinia] mediterraneensis TaxID=2161819 RepID=UPI0010323286|nr:hypothetical protein [[Erwinia] mediterraneensis]